MARKGSSKKAVYVTHKKQTDTQRRINKNTGVRESSSKKERNKRYRDIRKAFGLSTG